MLCVYVWDFLLQFNNKLFVVGSTSRSIGLNPEMKKVYLREKLEQSPNLGKVLKPGLVALTQRKSERTRRAWRTRCQGRSRRKVFSWNPGNLQNSLEMISEVLLSYLQRNQSLRHFLSNFFLRPWCEKYFNT